MGLVHFSHRLHGQVFPHGIVVPMTDSQATYLKIELKKQVDDYMSPKPQIKFDQTGKSQGVSGISIFPTILDQFLVWGLIS